MMFYPGQIVVCVRPHAELGLKEGWKYPVGHVGGVTALGVKLSSGPNPPRNWVNDDGTVSTGFWDHNRFRPLDGDDLALLTQKHKIKEPTK